MSVNKLKNKNMKIFIKNGPGLSKDYSIRIEAKDMKNLTFTNPFKY